MAQNKASLDEIDRQATNLASAIKEAIADLTGQLATLTDRYRRLTGGDVGSTSSISSMPTGRRRGRPPGSGRKPESTSSASAGSSSGSTAGSSGGSPSTFSEKSARPRGKKRIRRTRDQLAKTADDIMNFIRKGGADGVKGAAIRAEFGTILPSIKEFVKSYGGKVIKTKGQKAAMTYHHGD